MRAVELLILLTANLGSTIKVFSFNTTEVWEEYSCATLVQRPTKPLPERFIACFAMKQDKPDGRSPFLMRGQIGLPWIDFGIWNYDEQIAFWEEVGKSEWKMFNILPRLWKFWRHICADIDTLSGNITVSIDGTPSVTNTFEKLSKQKPTGLDLDLGWTEAINAAGGIQSFRGEVSNFHFYSSNGSLSTETLSKKPCETQGNYLAWKGVKFSILGKNVLILNETEKDVCTVQPEFYNVLLP